MFPLAVPFRQNRRPRRARWDPSEGERLLRRVKITCYLDIYRLDEYRDEIVKLEGFGEKSWQRLWDAIQRSRNTTFERYLIAMDIPMLGNTASRTLARVFHNSLEEFEDAVLSGCDFTRLPDFWQTLHNNIQSCFQSGDNWYIWEELRTLVSVALPKEEATPESGGNPFYGLA